MHEVSKRIGKTDMSKTDLCVAGELDIYCSHQQLIQKINQLVSAVNFLDEHVNFLYARSRTLYNTLCDAQKGMQSMYDEFSAFRKSYIDSVEQEKQNGIEYKRNLDLIEFNTNN